MLFYGVIGAFAAAVAVPLFFKLMGKVKGLRPTSVLSRPLDELAKEYTFWEGLGVILFLVCTGVLCAILWLGLSVLSTFRMSYLEDSTYLLSPSGIIWGIPALFLAILLSVIPLHFLFLALLGKERYREYAQYGDHKVGFDSWKLLGYMAAVMIPLCLAFVLLSLDLYARVTDDGFVVNRFFGFGETRYDFEQIEYVELTKSFKAPGGNIVRRKYYSIGFDDGSHYSFHHELHGLDFEQQEELALFVSSKSNREVSVSDPYPVEER